MFGKHMNSQNTNPSGDALRVSRKATHEDTRNQNRRFVLQCIFSSAPTTRANISRATGLTRATVSNLISELLDEGLILELGTAPSKGGKPPTLLTISDDAYHVITIRLDGSEWTGSVLTLRRRVIETLTVKTAGRRGSPAIDALHDLVAKLLASTRQRVLGIGIATPGVVAPDGTVVQATALDWHGVAVGGLVADRFSIPTHVINDASAIALAEYSLGGHGTDNLFVVKIGTGVGAGIILDGRPYAGEGNAAGEIGHMAVLSTVSNENSATALEDLTSAHAIAERLGFDDPGDLDAGSVFREVARRVAAGDIEALRAVERGGRYLGIIMASVTGILDIHHLVVTGPVRQLGDAFLVPAREELSRRVLPAVAPRVDISFGRVDRPEEHGAAMSVLRSEMGIL